MGALVAALRISQLDLTTSGALRSEHLQALQHLMRAQRGFALIPSDTCYSLAAVPTGLKMSRLINKILDRKEEPISVAFDGITRLRDWVELNAIATRLVEKLTPGPLTIVCPLRVEVDPRITDDVLAAPDRTVGARIPDSRIEVQLVEACDHPITTVAVRDRRNRREVRDLNQAIEIVTAGLSRIEHPPPIAVVEVQKKFAEQHSTVVRVPARTPNRPYDLLRDGAIGTSALDQAIGSLSISEMLQP